MHVVVYDHACAAPDHRTGEPRIPQDGIIQQRGDLAWTWLGKLHRRETKGTRAETIAFSIDAWGGAPSSSSSFCSARAPPRRSAPLHCAALHSRTPPRDPVIASRPRKNLLSRLLQTQMYAHNCLSICTFTSACSLLSDLYSSSEPALCEVWLAVVVVTR